MADSDSEQGTLVHQNQPFDESLDVPDSEEVASVYTPSPRVPAAGNRGRSRGETPPDSRMSENYEDDIITGGPEHDHDESGIGFLLNLDVSVCALFYICAPAFC